MAHVNPDAYYYPFPITDKGMVKLYPDHHAKIIESLPEHVRLEKVKMLGTRILDEVKITVLKMCKVTLSRQDKVSVNYLFQAHNERLRDTTYRVDSGVFIDLLMIFLGDILPSSVDFGPLFQTFQDDQKCLIGTMVTPVYVFGLSPYVSGHITDLYPLNHYQNSEEINNAFMKEFPDTSFGDPLPVIDDVKSAWGLAQKHLLEYGSDLIWTDISTLTTYLNVRNSPEFCQNKEITERMTTLALFSMEASFRKSGNKFEVNVSINYHEF